jgi:hypothetical protein
MESARIAIGLMAFFFIGLGQVRGGFIFGSDGHLGALDVPAGATVGIDTNTMTFSWVGTSYTGRAVAHNGGTIAQFDFTNINIASGVTFNVSGSKPLAIVGTGNATVSSGMSVSSISANGIAGGGSGGTGGSGGIGLTVQRN